MRRNFSYDENRCHIFVVTCTWYFLLINNSNKLLIMVCMLTMIHLFVWFFLVVSSWTSSVDEYHQTNISKIYLKPNWNQTDYKNFEPENKQKKKNNHKQAHLVYVIDLMNETKRNEHNFGHHTERKKDMHQASSTRKKVRERRYHPKNQCVCLYRVL